MSEFNQGVPVVLSISSHDPTGSAGIQAVIETCLSLGCHCAPVISALCARDTRALKDFSTVDTALLIEQTRAILEDMPVAAVKLGYLGSVGHIEAVHTILRDYPKLPMVLHPVTNLSSDSAGVQSLVDASKALLLPLATLVTPDLVEARELAPQGDTLDACAQQIVGYGCEHALITGTRRDQHCYENSLYNRRGLVRRFSWPRLSQFSHGSGATLAAAIAAYLAHGLQLPDAVAQGQKFTWECLRHSRRLGMGHCIPNRLHWANSNPGNH